MIVLTEKYTVEGYLHLEEETGERYEFLGGDVIAMAGTTIEHDFISNNLIELLKNCLIEQGCFLVSGQVKMYTPDCDKAFLYPDIHIYCGELQKEKLPKGAYALTGPSFIIEILSRETHHYDKIDKFNCYRKIPSLKSYLMIESDLEKNKPALYLRTWNNEKSFKEETFTLEDTLDILGCPLNATKVYAMPDL